MVSSPKRSTVAEPFIWGGVVCLEPGCVLLGPKNVEGFMRVYELRDGGGTPRGYV